MIVKLTALKRGPSFQTILYMLHLRVMPAKAGIQNLIVDESIWRKMPFVPVHGLRAIALGMIWLFHVKKTVENAQRL
jgi:hypothetical protein